MRIYTRTGDSGDTGLFGGQRARKDSLRVQAYGEVDELNAVLGVAVVATQDEPLRAVLQRLQGELFQVGADLATPLVEGELVGRRTVPRVTETMVAALEGLIDTHEAELSPLTQFILPGGAPGGATLHQARGVCRRAERRVVALAEEETLNPPVLPYLNRLSDLLFVLARVANQRAGAAELPWEPPASGGQ